MELRLAAGPESAPRRSRPVALELQVEPLEAGTSLVTVAGELDAHAAPQLDQKLQDALGEGATSLVVDLTGCGFVDSTALGVLAGARAKVRALSVITADRNVRKVFELTGLARTLSIRLGPFGGHVNGRSSSERGLIGRAR